MRAKRLLGLVLALMLVFSAMPTVAHAASVAYPEYTSDTQVETEVYETVPSYKQTDEEYKDILYGNVTRRNGKKATIGSHGCGPTCLAMVATYLLDKEYTPADAAADFGEYNTIDGSYWILFEDSAEKLGLNLEKRTWEKKDVMAALENGQVVVALQSKGLFTNGGHFIVLTGLNDEGLIMVNDPNGANYTKNNTMKLGFKNGFTENQIFANGGPYWIYGKKDCVVEVDEVTEEMPDVLHTNGTAILYNS